VRPGGLQPPFAPGRATGRGHPADDGGRLSVQRLLALAAGVWINWQLGAPAKRSLVTYDH
jgi:hypothetical protein